jgi:DNA-binding CsgD family transcriptional regulator/tetratricopeptide (TPR) repeat protein
LRTQRADQRSELTRGLASLSTLFEGLDLPAPGADGDSLGDAALERTRLFEAVARLLGRIASQAPVVALFDDLHWADAGSLELLLYMSHDLAGLPVLWIVTYRAEEPTALQRRFRALRDSLLRPTTSRELHLERLNAEDVRALLITRLRGEPSPAVVDMITQRSKGVPLFVDALVRWLLDSGRMVEEKGRLQLSSAAPAGLPTVIRDVIAGRLGRLSKTERETLELIAVAGEARRDVLERVAPQHLDTGLSSLMRTGLVVQETGETIVRYRLEHPLVLEVAYEEMPVPRRGRLHLELAEALERLGDVSAQAIHYLAAGPAHQGSRALDVLLAAGQEALNRYADEQAARFFQAALPRAEQSRPDLVGQLLIGLGEASFRLGRLAEAARLWRSMLDGEFGARDPVRRARIHRLIAAAESERGAYDAAELELKSGIAGLEGLPPCEERLELLFLRAVTAARRMDSEAVLRAGRLIVEEGTRIETPRARVLTGIARGEAYLHSGEYTLAAEAYEEVAGAAETLRDPAMLRFVHDHRGTFAAALGDLAALRLANDRSLDLGRRVGVPGWDYRLYGNQFLEAFLSGEWDRAWEVCREARIASENVDNPRTVPAVFAVEAILAVFQGNPEGAEDRIRKGRSFLAQYFPAIAPAGISLDLATALLALERDDPSTALAVMEPVESHPVGSHLDSFLPPWGLVALAEARAKLGPFAAASKLIARLRDLGPEGAYPAVIADRLVGLTKLASGHPEDAIADLLRSRDGFRRLGMPFESARATIEAGEAMAPKSRSLLADLAGEISAAHQLAVRLGARRYEERAAVLLRAVGAPVHATDASSEAELTQRQLEVAQLVAKGLSNAEIAEHLFVSVRTVTSHLDHIYTRLGIDSRAALATHVTERRYARQLAPSGTRIT